MNTYRYVIQPFHHVPADLAAWHALPDYHTVEEESRGTAAIVAVERYFIRRGVAECTVHLLDPDDTVTVWQMEPTIHWGARRLS
jgi:hypothetical protein